MGSELIALLEKVSTQDQVRVYEVWSSFSGDSHKTALMLGLSPEEVEALAVQHDWKARLHRWTIATEGTKSAQLAINRAINLVQASRCRSIIDKVISFLSEGDAQALVERLTVTGKNGPEFKTRALTDLIKAAETAQRMTYLALGDSTGASQEPTGKGSSIALQVMAALNAADEVGLDSVAVVRKQLAEDKQIAHATTPDKQSTGPADALEQVPGA